MQEETIELSVVIPTYNRCEILALTLPSVLAQDFAETSREIIVVVDGSTDGTLKMLSQPAFCHVRVISQANSGLAAARNSGLKAARGHLVLFLDDDMQCGPSLFRLHVGAHRDRDQQIVEGAIELSSDDASRMVTHWRHQMTCRHFEEIRSKRDERWPWQAMRFANTSAPRSLLLEAGGFDERFRFAHEDLEFGLRLAQTPARYRYVPEIAVRHLNRKSVRDIIDRDAESYGRSHVLLSRLHPSYRRHSRLGNLRRGTWRKQLMRELAVRSPLSPISFLRPSFLIAERFSGSRLVRKAGTRLLDYAAEMGMFRGAVAAAGSWQAFRREFGMRLPVLMYHHVGPRRTGSNPALTVSPTAFTRQMTWLARNSYTPIRVADWIGWSSEGRQLPAKPVLITFDDGYADLSEYAVPVLRKFGFPALVFVVTSLIGKTNEWDQRAGWSSVQLMNTEQMREAASDGIEFGAHSRTHLDLTQVLAEKLRTEVTGSAEDLAGRLGAAPLAFAYPFGAYNEQVRDEVSRVYSVAFTVREGFNSLASDPHQLRRIGILPGDHVPKFGWIMKAGIHPIDQLRDRLQLRANLRKIGRRFLAPSLLHR
jgi:GT2 family glycosyltransferase/peptidoglycan/xylan/chitin deacetylase (PgdA/CDA1 family)